MAAFTLSILIIFLVTSQYINAYPSAINKQHNGHEKNLRLKRHYGLLEHHEIANKFNDDIPLNFDENLSNFYMIVPRPPNRKRLIDF